MTTFLLIVIALLAIALGVFILLKKHLDKKLAQAKDDFTKQVEKGRNEVQALRDEYNREAGRISADYEQRSPPSKTKPRGCASTTRPKPSKHKKRRTPPF